MQHFATLVPSSYLIQKHKDDFRFIYRQLELLTGFFHKGNHYFNPTPNPVPLVHENLSILLQHKYGIMEKTDGIRYTCIFTKLQSNTPVCVFMDRSCRLFQVNVTTKNIDLFKGTVIDGELVCERTQTNKQFYVTFDCLAFKGKSQVELIDFLERRKALDEIKESVKFESNFSMMIKPCYFVRDFMNMNQMIENNSLPYNSDGIIFMPIQYPVKSATQQNLLKFKTENTVDCTLILTKSIHGNEVFMQLCYKNDQSYQSTKTIVNADIMLGFDVLLQGQGLKVFFVLSPTDAILRQLIGEFCNQAEQQTCSHIVELKLMYTSNEIQSGQQILCHIKRIRTDKDTPNNYKNIHDTVVNFMNSIQAHEVFQFMNQHGLVV